MKTKEYSEVIKSVITLEIKETFDKNNYYDSEYWQGYVAGLYMVLDKINKSSFLFEEDTQED